VTLNCFVTDCGTGVSESLTETVNAAFPALKGVPEIIPIEFKASFAGKLLPDARLHV
jgi:hypothetical protein